MTNEERQALVKLADAISFIAARCWVQLGTTNMAVVCKDVADAANVLAPRIATGRKKVAKRSQKSPKAAKRAR